MTNGKFCNFHALSLVFVGQLFINKKSYFIWKWGSNSEIYHIQKIFFQLTWPLGHVNYCHHFSSIVRRPSINISHFNLLLRNHWANTGNSNQTLVEWSLDGPLPKLCLVIPISNQDGRQAKNRNKGGEIKKIFSSETTEPFSTKLC